MLCLFWPFLIFFDGFLRFDFFLRQLFLIPAPAVLGNRDGSIRALRRRRSSNETDNFIESISQMVPRWSPEVPDGPQRSPKPITSCGRSPKTDNFLRPGDFLGDRQGTPCKSLEIP